jgi:N-acyl homoserine lactone hydrolase
MGLTVHRLNLGEMTSDWSFTVFGRPPGTTIVGPANGFLILGGADPIVVDAGTRNAEVIERLGLEPRWNDEQTLEAQLALHGVELSDVGMVILTHLHVDHAGRLDAFPLTTPAIVNRAELAYAFNGVQGLFYAPEDLHHVLDRMYTPGALGILDLPLGDRAGLLPGVSVIALGGHTPGSVGVLVETEEGTACLCGDVLYEVEGSLVNPVLQMHYNQAQISGNHATSILEEKAAVTRAINAGRFLYPSHDPFGAVIEDGWIVGRIGSTVPGPVLPYEAVPSLIEQAV